MTKHIPVPVELLEELRLMIGSSDIPFPQRVDIRANLRALLNGPGVEPVQAVPDGWQLVPKEPTPEMVAAAIDAHDAKPLSDWGKIIPATDEEIYCAMLAAAPQHPATTAKENGE